MHWRLLLHEVEFNGEHEVGPFLIFPLPFQSISQGIIDDDSDRGPTPSTSLFYKSTDVLVIQVHDYFWHNCRYLRGSSRLLPFPFTINYQISNVSKMAYVEATTASSLPRYLCSYVFR